MSIVILHLFLTIEIKRILLTLSSVECILYIGGGKVLATNEKIRLLLKRKNITITELADKIDTTRQNLTNKLSRNNFNEIDLQKIAEALDQELSIVFKDKESGNEL